VRREMLEKLRDAKRQEVEQQKKAAAGAENGTEGTDALTE